MTAEPAITLLIVDDHPVVSDGLRCLFESAQGLLGLGDAADGSDPELKALRQI